MIILVAVRFFVLFAVYTSQRRWLIGLVTVYFKHSIWSFFSLAFSLWCEQAGANFGEVLIPTTLPAAVKAVDDSALLLCSVSGISIGTFVTRAHNVTGEVFIVSSRILEVSVRALLVMQFAGDVVV
jgi:hypothetical protein